MTAVVYGLHLMVVVALIFLVLMQRSEGGALGMGGSSNSMMTGRGAADALARGTGILGAIFFITSLSLTLMAGGQRAPASVVDQPAGNVLNLSFDPVVRWFEDLNKGAPSQQPALTAPAPSPLAAATPVAPPEPATTEAVPPTGDVAPAPTSVLTRAAPLAEPSVTPAPAAPALAANRPAAAVVPARPAAPAPVVSARPPAPVSASNNAAVAPAELTEPAAPAARPRGRSGPDE